MPNKKPPSNLSLPQGRSDLGHPKNEHSPRARRRKMQRYLDKHYPIKKDDKQEKDNG